MANETVEICAICDKEIPKGKMTATKIDGLWVCGFGCISKFQKGKKKWTSGEWEELRERQTSFEQQSIQPAQTERTSLIENVIMEATGSNGGGLQLLANRIPN